MLYKFSGALKSLFVCWLELYFQIVELNELQSSTAPQNQSCLEVVNKLVRVLANSAIGETVGRLAVVSTESLDLFLDLIGEFIL